MKIQNFILTTLLISGATVFLASCKKENSDPLGITYQLQTSNRSSIVGRVASGNIVWTSGFGNATQVKFEGKGPNGEIEYKSSLQQRIDLFSGVSTLGNVTLPAGTYQEVEFEVKLNPTATEPALSLSGTYASTGAAVPITFNISAPLELETELNNVTVLTNNSYNALTTLNLSLLTRGITQAMLDNAVKTNGVIVISSSSNVNLYTIIFDNLRDCDGMEFDED